MLGAWGIQLRENVRENISVIRKNLIIKKIKEPVPPNDKEEEKTLPDQIPIDTFTVCFDTGNKGTINGQNKYIKYTGDNLSESEIPKIEANEGYEFTGWSEEPNNHIVLKDKVFLAQYREILPPISPGSKPPWWKRLWLYLTSSGCLKWLLWLLISLLLLMLILWLLRGCDSHTVGRDNLKNNENELQNDVPNHRDGVNDDVSNGETYDPNNPYQSIPTPPKYKDILPPFKGKMPPLEENPEIEPGNPSIIANRLNILMENEDKSILDLARDFKTQYPDDKYKIIYYDDVVKRIQIKVPSQERKQLKQDIPSKFSAKYKLFVFEESLFEGAYTPSDPAFSDPNKSWYLKTIKAPKAWDITRGSDKITIAIVDNGFNLQHPELRSKVVKPYNVWLHSKKIFPQQIDHGTHVAGTALALAGNGKGLCGIAPNCKFMPIQVADKKGKITTSAVTPFLEVEGFQAN